MSAADDDALSPADCWPAARLGEALEALVRSVGWQPRTSGVWPPDNVEQLTVAEVGSWLAFAADQYGVDLAPQPVPYLAAGEVLRGFGPGLVQVFGGDASSYLAVRRAHGDALELVTPAHRVRRVSADDVRAAFCHGLEAPYGAEIEALLERASVRPRARPRARVALLRGRLVDQTVEGCWNVRLAAGSPFVEQLRGVGALRRIAAMVGLHGAQYALATGATVLLGRGALAGTVDPSWMLGWALLLVTLVPLRAAARWGAGALAVEVEALLKRRLLAGVMRLDPDELRHEGAGAFLARVFESEAMQTLVIGGGMAALFALLDVGLAALVLSQGVGGAVLLALLGAALAVLAYGVRRLGVEARARAAARMTITHALVEQMVGHRTRLAQQRPGEWHDREDADMARYLVAANAQDATAARLGALPRMWTLLAVALALPAMLDLRADVGRLALALFGVLLTERALRSVLGGAVALTGAWVSWTQMRETFRAAARPVALGSPAYVQRRSTGAVLEARDIVYSHQGRGTATLRGASVRVGPGDRVLLEGGSGGGKSTFGALLAGLRTPASGLLLVDGLDPQTLGSDGWRRRVTIAPQFHENHIFSGSVAFNLLMGRRWPATSQDIADAQAVCRELRLEIIGQMPNRMHQVVGETGWQLSHGERSRIYIARALLQGADVVIFDESLGALDPERYAQALACITRRARGLVLIAHT